MLKQSIAGIRPGNSDCKQRLLSWKLPVSYRTAFNQVAVFSGGTWMTITIWRVSTRYFQNSFSLERNVVWFDRAIAVRLITRFEALNWNQSCVHACTWNWRAVEVSFFTAVCISEALMNITMVVNIGKRLQFIIYEIIMCSMFKGSKQQQCLRKYYTAV